MEDRPAKARTRRTISTMRRMVPRPMYMSRFLSSCALRADSFRMDLPQGSGARVWIGGYPVASASEPALQRYAEFVPVGSTHEQGDTLPA